MANTRELLSRLLLETAQATLEALASGSLRREEEDYTFKDVFLLSRGGAGKGWTGRSRQETRTVWNAYDINRIAEEVGQRFESEWDQCAQELQTQQDLAPKKDLPVVRGDLGQMRLVVVANVADDSSAESVPRIVDRILYEYKGGPLSWNGRLWLNGIAASELIEVHPGFVLRPATGKDLSSEGPTQAFRAEWSFSRVFDVPDSILETACSSRDKPDLRREIVALSLFRTARVEIIEDNWQSDSVFPYQRGSRSEYHTSPRSSKPYSLNGAEGPALAAFLAEISNILPMNPLGHHDAPGRVGLKNYFRALRTATDEEERIGQAVASLEASLLGGDVKAEVGNRVSLRAATLLRFAGLNPTNIYRETMEAYKLRSIYAHGGDFNAKQLRQAQDLSPRIMDYARLAVVKFLQFPSKAERTEILKRLDLALLDENESRLLEGRLRGGLWDYALAAANQENS